MTMSWIPTTNPRSKAVICEVGHGEWWICPFPGDVIELRYGRKREIGLPLLHSIGYFASVAEAMLAVDMYERDTAKSDWQQMLADAAFMPVAATGTFYQHRDGTGGHCLTIDDHEIKLSGDIAAERRFSVGSLDRAALRRLGVGNQAADLAVFLEILAARRQCGAADRPLTIAQLEAWRRQAASEPPTSLSDLACVP